MIDAKELKKGNKVLFEGMLLTIKEIKEHEATFEETPAAVEYPDIDAVPLTPELLEACGFENTHPKSWYLSWESYELQYSTDDKELGILSPDGCTTGHTVYFPCTYLHLLQNIYFFFTNTELEVNLNKEKV